MSEEILENHFVCYNCNFTMDYFHKGKKPKNLPKDIELLEDAYSIRDPFQENQGCVVLGADCSICGKMVCISQDCSIFYSKRFCVQCVRKNYDKFPVEIQKEIKMKELST